MISYARFAQRRTVMWKCFFFFWGGIWMDPTLDCPVCSFDCHLIEKLWGILVGKVYAYGRQFATVLELRNCIKGCWGEKEPAVQKKTWWDLCRTAIFSQMKLHFSSAPYVRWAIQGCALLYLEFITRVFLPNKRFYSTVNLLDLFITFFIKNAYFFFDESNRIS